MAPQQQQPVVSSTKKIKQKQVSKKVNPLSLSDKTDKSYTREKVKIN